MRSSSLPARSRLRLSGAALVCSTLFYYGCSNPDKPVNGTDDDLPVAHAIWVDTAGDDAADGSENKPFKTLQHAREVVRTLQDKNEINGNIAVYLKSGIHRLNETVQFAPEDGGRNGHQVIYRNAPGSTNTVVSGALPVTNWQNSEFPGVWVAQLSKGLRTRQLYVNGIRATRAQSNDTNAYPLGFRPSWHTYVSTKNSGDTLSRNGGIEFIPNILNNLTWFDPALWTNVEDIEAVIITQWKMMRVPLASVSSEKTKSVFLKNTNVGLIKLQEPGWTNSNVFRTPGDTSQPGIWGFWEITRFENALQFLDKAGEWYYDRHTGLLYYKPLPGQTQQNTAAEFPVLEKLLDLTGAPGKPVSNIRFEGITFTGATWNNPSTGEGYVADQSGFFLTGYKNETNVIGHVKHLARTPGSISLTYTDHIVFRNNTFEHLGSAGIDFVTGCKSNSILLNNFGDISSAAIQLGGVNVSDAHPADTADWVSCNTITDNAIYKTGRDYVDAAGIMIGFTNNTDVSYNIISEVPWAGVAIGWGWGLYDPYVTAQGDSSTFPGVPGGTPGMWGIYKNASSNHHNKISYNLISRFVQQVWDAGAVYTTGHQGTSFDDGLLIEGNIAFDKFPRGGSNIFYTDGGSRFITVRGNLSYNNAQGSIYFGVLPSLADPINYTEFPISIADLFPYGSEIGGCVTYGDIRYEGNYWQNLWSDSRLTDYMELHGLLDTALTNWPKNPVYYDPCHQGNGLNSKYPVNLTLQNNTIIKTASDAPAELQGKAGPRKKKGAK